MSAASEVIGGRFLADPPEGPPAVIPCRRGVDKRTGLQCRIYEVPYKLPDLDTDDLKSKAALLIKVRHPSLENLLGVFSNGMGPGSSVRWVYEAAEGKTFGELAQEGRPFSEAEAAGIAAALTGALKKLHVPGGGLHSGGISPGNIYLAAGGRPVLAGVKPFKTADAAYYPPGEPPSTSGDIYALGACLAFLFSRKTPEEFRAEGGFGGIKRYTGFSQEFCRVLDKMTAESPDDRYRSAEELEKDLVVLLAGSRPSGLARLFRGVLLLALAAAAAGGALTLLPAGDRVADLKAGRVDWAVPGGLSFSADGKLLALAGDRALHVWETAGWGKAGPSLPVNRPGLYTRGAAFLPDGSLAVGSSTGEGESDIKQISAENGRVLWSKRLADKLDSLAVSPDGGLIAAAVNKYDRAEQRHYGGDVRIYDRSGAETAAFRTAGPVFTLNFTPDGRGLAYKTYFWDASAKVQNLGVIVRRDLASGSETVLLREKPGLGSPLYSVSSSGQLVTPEGTEEALNVTDASGLKLAGLNEDCYAQEYRYTTSAEGAFSPDGRLFAAHITKKNRLYLRVFGTEGWKVIKEYKLGKWKDGGVAAIAFSPDGSVLAAAQGNAFKSRVRVFKVEGQAAGGN